MSRRNRKTKSPSRRTRRKKRSKLMAALVIEVIAAVSLFGAYRFAQDVRASQRSGQPEQSQTEQAQSPAAWAKFASALTPVESSDQTPVFRVSRLIGFASEGS